MKNSNPKFSAKISNDSNPEFSSQIINLKDTTLSKVEAETIETFSNLEKAKTLKSCYNTKSFFCLGAGAISLSLGVTGVAACLFTNIDNTIAIGVVSTFMTTLSFAGLTDGLNLMQKSKLEDAKSVCLTEKISMLREKIKNNGSEITTTPLIK